jgi:4-diphosphocytidyl-2-C-methyl-D-erythritol kinase
MAPLTARAYAKINIGLHIVRRRLDGYRDIETIFHRVDLCDDLAFEAAPALSLVCSDPSIPTDETNLCMKAATMLRAYARIGAGARITLTKRIPAGAGLGGGSSDAAATLRGLARLWDVRIPERDLAAMALAIGSDVPYFLGEGSALGRGRGELLDFFRLDLPYWIVVATPRVHVSTAWAYAQTPIPVRPPGEDLRSVVLAHVADARSYRARLQNDFEPLVLAAHREVAAAKEALEGAGAEFAQMSGSGSSVYGLFASEQSARTALGALRACRLSLTAPHFQPS